MSTLPLPLPAYDDVAQAAGRIAGVANRTPVLTSRTIDETFGAQVFFKCENMHHPDVIAGQGMAAKELFEEVGPLDAFFVCRSARSRSCTSTPRKPSRTTPGPSTWATSRSPSSGAPSTTS